MIRSEPVPSSASKNAPQDSDDDDFHVASKSANLTDSNGHPYSSQDLPLASPARTRDGTFSEGGESLLHLADASMALSPGGFSNFGVSPQRPHHRSALFAHGTPGRPLGVDTHAQEDVHSAEALVAMASPARPPQTRRHPIAALNSSGDESSELDD